MPRDPSGKYDLPENQVVGGTTILADWANNTTGDLETEMTDSLSRQGKGGMQGSLKAAQKDIDGNAVIGVSWVDEPTTGRYLQSAGVVVETIQGNDVVRYTSSGLEEFRDGSWVTLSSQDAIQVPYDNSVSHLVSTNVQHAIDELDNLIDTGYVTFDGDETISGAKTFTASETQIDGDVFLGGSENKILGATRNPVIHQNSAGDTIVGNIGSYTVQDCLSDEAVYHRWGTGDSLALALNESNFESLMTDTIKRIVIDTMVPVGELYISRVNRDPSTIFPGTTWARAGEGLYLATVGSSPDDSNGDKSTIVEHTNNLGVWNTTLTVENLPPHNHVAGQGGSAAGDQHHRRSTERTVYSNDNTYTEDFGVHAGGVNPESKSFPNYVPSYGVYTWRRTA